MWFENRRSSGWEADYSDLSVKGFPNRLDTTISSPRLGGSATDVVWETPFLQLLRLSYDPSHLIVIAANQQTFSVPSGDVGVSTSDLRASLEMTDISTWTPERLIVVAKDLNVSATQGWAIKSDVAQLSTEVVSGSEYRVALDARGISAAFSDILNNSTGSKIDRLTIDAVMTLSAPLSRASVEVARPQPQKITLNLAEAEWSGLKLAAAGMLDITPAGTPIGQITLKLRNWREMLEQERQQSRLSNNVLNKIELTLALISGLSGNPETLDLPFDFRNGQIWLGPLNLGSSPLIMIP